MISNPDLILYACIAKKSTVLTQFISSKESGIELIAQKCIEKTPSHHSYFSHTVRKTTYSFLITDPFAYFVILHENLDKSESLWFLNRVKIAFELFLESSKNNHELSYHCFQDEFYPVFQEILSIDSDLVDSLMEVPKEIRNPSMDSTGGKRSVVRPLLSKPAKLIMKKKKRPVLGCGGCVGDAKSVDNSKISENGGSVLANEEFSVSMRKNGGGYYLGGVRGGVGGGEGNKLKAKQIWRKHVWIVLILDLVICVVLFGIWLWVCRGFKCIDG
ncbi:phytolongin Phyl2.2 [Mercurialis annua]|uniref:phytolongin Phyl2.2 n=1 Tax=Mercurialis annua TaxID=3986 RepID=UPI00215E0C9D|nr:phytolongin Phyl2.2 [Mercurialis annua]